MAVCPSSYENCGIPRYEYCCGGCCFTELPPHSGGRIRPVPTCAARSARQARPALRVQSARQARPALRVQRVQSARLPRQYMHNKENAVTMRLSAHYRQLNNPYNYT